MYNSHCAGTLNKLLLARLACISVIVHACGALATPAAAQTCGTDYEIKAGDSLSGIAALAYGNANQWTILFYANQDRLGANSSLLVPGLAIRVPCLGSSAVPAPVSPAAPASTTKLPAATAPANGAPVGRPDAVPARSSVMISTLVRRVEVLTADGFSPYTGRALEGGGLLTELMTGSLEYIRAESKGTFEFGISWVNDWSAHLQPLLTSRAFDLGFPWSRPDCGNPHILDQPSRVRCERFFFSDPLYEVVLLAFVKTDSKLKSSSADMKGVTICQQAGSSTHYLDAGGRNWLKDGTVLLMRPPTVEDCFRLLAAGSVDAVVSPELVGRSAAAATGMADGVRELDPPLGLTTMHALIAKAHPNARTILYYLNTGLMHMRETGAYDKITERHLERFWASQTKPDPTLATAPATAATRPAVSGAPVTETSSTRATR